MAKSQRAQKRRNPARPQFDRDVVSIHLAAAEAALQTAILAMENKGVLSAVAFSLRTHVLFPLLSLKDEISGKSATLRRASRASVVPHG
jgi:hypothetical protein